MTSITTVVGVLPLVFGWGSGGELYQPLAAGIIGGAVSATLVTFFLLPTAYAVVEKRAERRRGEGAEQAEGRRGSPVIRWAAARPAVIWATAVAVLLAGGVAFTKLPLATRTRSSCRGSGSGQLAGGLRRADRGVHHLADGGGDPAGAGGAAHQQRIGRPGQHRSPSSLTPARTSA